MHNQFNDCMSMSRKISIRIVYTLGIVLVWLGFVLEGSHALFSDAASLTGNALATGNAALEVSNSQNGSSTLFAEVRPGFSYTLSPGQHEDKYFILRNNSGSEVPLDISVSPAIQAPTASDLLPAFHLEFTPVDSSGALIGSSVDGNLSTMSIQPMSLGVVIPKGETQRFRLRAALLSTYAQQDQSLAYDLVFTGNQHLNP